MGQSNTTREKSFYKRHPITSQIIVGVVGIIVGAFIDSFISAKNEELTRRDLVKEMSESFADVEEDMTFRKAIETITESYNREIDDNKKLSLIIDEKETEIEDLKAQINQMPKVEFSSIGMVLNGLKAEEEIKKGWADIDGKNYYSEDTVNSLLKSEIFFNRDDKTLFYDDSGTSNPKETKVSLEESNTLYDGSRCKYYKSSEPETFSLGSNTYKSGFTLETGYTGRADGNYSNALFDLKGKYSKISFDVGKVTGEYNLNAIMSIYIDDKHLQDYDLSVNVVSKHFDIDLNYADNLRIQININDYHGTKYGFANVVFEY